MGTVRAAGLGAGGGCGGPCAVWATSPRAGVIDETERKLSSVGQAGGTEALRLQIEQIRFDRDELHKEARGRARAGASARR